MRRGFPRTGNSTKDRWPRAGRLAPPGIPSLNWRPRSRWSTRPAAGRPTPIWASSCWARCSSRAGARVSMCWRKGRSFVPCGFPVWASWICWPRGKTRASPARSWRPPSAVPCAAGWSRARCTTSTPTPWAASRAMQDSSAVSRIFCNSPLPCARPTTAAASRGAHRWSSRRCFAR